MERLLEKISEGRLPVLSLYPHQTTSVYEIDGWRTRNNRGCHGALHMAAWQLFQASLFEIQIEA